MQIERKSPHILTYTRVIAPQSEHKAIGCGQIGLLVYIMHEKMLLLFEPGFIVLKQFLRLYIAH